MDYELLNLFEDETSLNLLNLRSLFLFYLFFNYEVMQKCLGIGSVKKIK